MPPSIEVYWTDLPSLGRNDNAGDWKLHSTLTSDRSELWLAFFRPPHLS